MSRRLRAEESLFEDSSVPEYERGLNPEQLAVVRHEDGPLAVFAGAGAGKTSAVTKRVVRLVSHVGVSADRIFCVTFSRAGADEMAARVRLLGVGGVEVKTWHAFCGRVLREEGVPEGRWNVDDKDRAKLFVKQAGGWQHEKWTGMDLTKVRSFIGVCKANLFEADSPEALALAKKKFGPAGARAVRVFKKSQELIEEAQLLTFDDMLVYVARYFARDDEMRARWAARFDYVMTDEAQDNNVAQVTLARFLAKDHRNLMVVGDPGQCIPEGELVSTPAGYRSIESIKVGDIVHSVKGGKVVPARVLRTSCTPKTEAFEFAIAQAGNSVGKIRATAEHVMFAAISDPGGSFVYLMYRHDLGFRIGVSRTAGHNGFNFIVRTQQENAERLWVLRWFETYPEAAELEAEYAYAFGIPREPFVPRDNMWSGSVEATARLFGKFGANGRALLDAAGIDFDRPNYFAKASGRGRVAVNILMATKDGHRVEVETGIADHAKCVALGMLPTMRGMMRTRRNFRSLREARAEAARIASTLGGYVTECLSGTGSKRRMRTVRALNVHPGMEVPVVVGGHLQSAKVLSKKSVPAARCYDLEVEDLGTFIVGGVVVHNSLYGFRGSDPKYLTDFPGEWDARVVTMAKNYRSGRAIVEVANAIIREGAHRLPEDMSAERGVDGTVEVIAADNLDDEAAEFVDFCKAHAAAGKSLADVTVCTCGLIPDSVNAHEKTRRQVGSGEGDRALRDSTPDAGDRPNLGLQPIDDRSSAQGGGEVAGSRRGAGWGTARPVEGRPIQDVTRLRNGACWVGEVSDGAPGRHGEEARSLVTAGRGRAPSQSRSGGQPTGEFATARDERGAHEGTHSALARADAQALQAGAQYDASGGGVGLRADDGLPSRQGRGDHAVDVRRAHASSCSYGKVKPAGSLSDIVVLFRLNAQSRALEEALLREKLPYVLIGGVNFYERKAVKDLLAYLRLAAGDDKEGDAVKRCINAPFRFLGAKFVERVMAVAASGSCSTERGPEWTQVASIASAQAGIQERQRASVREWVEIVEHVREMIVDGVPAADPVCSKCGRPDDQSQGTCRDGSHCEPAAKMVPADAAAVLGYVVKATNYVSWLEKEEGEESIESSHAADVREMQRVAASFKSVGELLAFVDDQVKESALNKRKRGDRCVTMMSCHRSKGLEWPVVWLVGCNDAILPHAKGDPEEERRIMYVAATRARDHLVVSYVKEMALRTGLRAVDRSPFLDVFPGVLEPTEDELDEMIGATAGGGDIRLDEAQADPEELAGEVVENGRNPGSVRELSPTLAAVYGDGTCLDCDAPLATHGESCAG